MKVWLHHINLSTAQPGEMDKFYRNILDLTEAPGRAEGRRGRHIYQGATTYVTDGKFEFHLSQKDHTVGFAANQQVNPVDRGHIAFRTDDLEGFKKKLEQNNIPYSDYGMWGMATFDQIYFYDPAGNVIEVHQEKPA